MKTTKIVMTLVICYLLIQWARQGFDFALPQVLPFMGGHEPSWLYDTAGVLMILIGIWGWWRLSRKDEDETH